MNREPKYTIGTKFKNTRRKHAKIETITDIIRHINNNGECIAIRYHTQCEILGQIITGYDVLESTITRSLITE